ncbi:MAG: DNA endonuclease SmrA [Vibrio sp.]
MSVNEDMSLFLEMMQDVKPLEQDTCLNHQKKQITQAHLARQRAAVTLTATPQDGLSIDDAPPVKPDDVISFKRDGIQEGVHRKLRLGKYQLNARLDLHKMTLAQARDEIVDFLRQAQRYDSRSVIIVHGKGAKSNPPALMKSHIAAWLTQIEEVMCYHSALPQHGGTGAVYVLLRKSPEKKLENRERHQKRLAS